MNTLTINQMEIRQLELSDSLGYRKEIISWVLGVIGSATESPEHTSAESDPLHTSASDVCRTLIAEAYEIHGARIERFLKDAGIDRSEDVGRIVYGLIEKDLVHENEGDSLSDFDDVFDSENIFRFIAEKGIPKNLLKSSAIYSGVMWSLYSIGTLLVFGSYTGWVSTDVALGGWVIAMVGFSMQFFRRKFEA